MAENTVFLDSLSCEVSSKNAYDYARYEKCPDIPEKNHKRGV